MHSYRRRRQPDFGFFFSPNSILRKVISLVAIWAFVLTSSPASPATLPQSGEPVVVAHGLVLPLRPLMGPTHVSQAAQAMSAPLGSPAALKKTALAAMALQSTPALGVFVGYADSSSASLNFPTPWKGSPNVVFVGSGTPVNAGAIRIDNPGSAPLTIDSVAVDLQRSNAQFNLWGSFTIPGGASAILTQTQPGNFDTSAFPIVACGGTLAAGETRIPKITITMGGTPQTFLDAAHVLDTGGFDLSCRGNESLQWRQIGSAGIESPAGHLALTPPSQSSAGGSPVSVAAQLTDASGAALSNVVVEFKISSGPDAGQTAQDVTDSQGNAHFTFVGSNQGTDQIQASVLNSSGATFVSSLASVNWQTASCAPGSSSQSGTPSLIYIGTAAGEFNDAAELATLLLDGSGTPVTGRALAFSFAGQTFSGTTDATGVARAAITLTSAPGQIPVTVNFAGDGTLPQLSTSASIAVDRDETLIRYTGKTLLGNSSPQPVSAVLLDPQSLVPIANELVTFRVGTATVSATTDANGLAAAAISLGASQVGPSSMTISFAGDEFFKPSVRTIPVTLFFPAGFVVWGGNNNGLTIGQQVNFWGAQWEGQVINGQYFAANPSFKGWSGSLAPIQQCQANATPSTITTACWQVKPGQSFPPNEVLPDYIEVVVSTVIVKSGDTVFGNIACGAVVKVNHTPPYGAVPGQPGFGTIAAVDGSCGRVFPPPAVITAVQTQPASVLPNQTITISANISNSSTATAATGVTLNETLDGLTPATASVNVGTIAAGGSQPATFQATVPAIPIRQSSETSTDYIQRLASLNGRLFTTSGQVTFTDAQQQNYLPVDVSSSSALRIPILTLGLTGPAVVSPGAPTNYLVTATNIGSAPASSVQISMTLPDGTVQVLTVPSISAGSSFSQPVNFTAAAIAPKGANETTDQYLARLAAADGKLLTAGATVNWSDALGNAYGDVGQQVFSSQVRVPILNFSGTAPATLLPSQNATLNFSINNSGGCTAALSTLQVTNPDNSTASAPQFPLAAGQSTTAQTTWHVTAFPARSGSETDAAYLTRLTAVNNSTLNFLGSLSWTDPEGVAYGPTTEPVQSKEVVPIVTIALSAPATAQAGTTIGYAVTLTNTGGATSPAVNLSITLPDGSTQTPAVGPLAPGTVYQNTINFAIPSSQAAGVISAQATVLWNDAVQNAYGPLSATAQTTVTNPAQFNSLVLAPAIAGPDVTGTSQTLTATLKDSTSAPIANATVTFTVTGANPTTGTATTNSSGVATFTYTGTHNGNDSVQATSGTAVSNTATVSWITPVQNISTSTIFARFFASDGSGGFNTPPTATPAFTQTFPTINFNPPAGTIPGNTSGIGVNTRPFIDVTTDLNGNFTGTITAQGNGVQAGLGSLFTFQAVFTSTFTVANAGDVVLSFFSDDGFILGVGGGATRVSGPLLNVPPSGRTAFTNLPVMGAFNSATAPIANSIVVHFPAAGTYPYELDYTECCAGQEALTMTVGQSNFKGVPPTGSLTISPNNPPTLPAGQTQTFTVQASDASGLPVPNVGVALIINGANQQQLSRTTDANGRATFSYSAVNAGTDSLQAVANIGSIGAFSNMVTVNWSVPTGGGGGGGTITFAQQGWIGGPLIGTVVQGQVPITVAPGISLTSGTLKYWPTSDPNDVHTISANTTGSGTIGVFDATALANGGYTVQLQATASNGTQQTSVIVLTVTGDNKPGRFSTIVTDLVVPLVGIPISVERSYDSLDRDTTGDFGNGWKLALGGTQLTTDAAGNVSFTIGGRRMTFFFKPQSSGFPFTFLLLPQYAPDAGVFGTLTGDGCGLLVQTQSGFTCFLDINPYQPTTLTYTDPTGRVYVMRAADGALNSVREPNGNTLTFSSAGITSTAGGVVVPFNRDPQGRITQITDPLGNSYLYGYDGSGNLSTVQLPAIAAPVTYTYSSDHLLIGEKDPRGNSASSTYFPDGRLQSITDAANQTTSYAYNLSTNTTTITYPDGGTEVRQYDATGNLIRHVDGLNRATTFTYDARRNVLTQTDALGKITTYTYDANGNRTSLKDPLSHIWSGTYNSFGGPVTLTDPLNQTQNITYDDNGNLSTISDPLGQAVLFTYNDQGIPITMTDARGNLSSYTYDQLGNRTSSTDALNRTSRSAYDTMGRLTSETDARNNTTQYGYDALGRRTSVTDALGNVAGFEYDAVGNKTADVDRLSRRTTYTYDAVNRLTQITWPDTTTTTYTYDFRGNKLTETDQLGHVTKYVYDKAGQLSSVTYAFGTPDASTTSYTYDLDGRKLTETDGRSNTITYTYDDAGRLTSRKDGQGNVTSYAYDAKGELTRMTDAKNRATNYAYDARGRLITTTTPDNKSVTKSYDGQGLLLSVTDEENQTTAFTYDVASQLVSVTDPLSHTTQYGYDLSGNRNSQTDAKQHTISYAFDALNRRSQRTLPGGESETYGYDAVGNVTSHADFNGKTTTYTYDSLNRRLRRIPDPSLAQPSVVFTYTATGKRASMTDASGQTTYAYDNRDRLKTKTTPQGALTYTYDAVSNVASVGSSNANGTSVQYGYDRANRLTSVTDNRTGGTTNYTIDPVGQVLAATYPNGVQHAFSYDTRDRLTTLNLTRLSTTLAGYTQVFSFSGRKTSIAEAGGRTATYGYDAAYRLLSESITGASPASGNGALTYTLDPVGNRLSLASALAALSPQTSTYDADDHLSGDTYDANGNTIASGGHAYTYDFEDRLTGFDNTVGLVYDGDGNLVAHTEAGTTIRFLIDDLNPTGYPQVAEDVLNGAIFTQYTYGTMRISQRRFVAGTNFQVSYYGYDGGGSVRQLFDPSGAVTDTYTYDAFGNTIAHTGNTVNLFLYRGEQLLATPGLYYLRARYYNPLTGRFLTQDKFEPSDPILCSCGGDSWVGPSRGGWNRYAYANSDPVNHIDPTGYATLFEYTIQIRNRVFSIALHPGHHYWTILGYKLYCIHIQLLTYLVGGATGNQWRTQIPLPWCSGSPF